MDSEQKVSTVIGSPGYGPERQIEVKFADATIVTGGTFGVIYKAALCETNERVAVKKVFYGVGQNRELEILRSLRHQNIVQLRYYFISRDRLIEQHKDDNISLVHNKVFTFQLFRALAYLHSFDISHRDLKPTNILVDRESSILMVSDFGSAKRLNCHEASVAYVCSRYYRAPELLFGSSFYTTKVDLWSAGCILIELFHGRPIFAGESTFNQIEQIIKLLGSPNADQMKQMNPEFPKCTFPSGTVNGLDQMFPENSHPMVKQLAGQLLAYYPGQRIPPLQACCHGFFDEIRTMGCQLPDGRPLPPLFNFSEYELKIDPTLKTKLIPPHCRGAVTTACTDVASGPSGGSGKMAAVSLPVNDNDGLPDPHKPLEEEITTPANVEAQNKEQLQELAEKISKMQC